MLWVQVWIVNFEFRSFWDFYVISNDKDYRKFIISHTLALDINKIASLKSYVLRAFQQYQKHPNFPQKISFHFI